MYSCQGVDLDQNDMVVALCERIISMKRTKYTEKNEIFVLCRTTLVAQ